MGIFDFFKKKEEKTIEKIKIEDINKFLLNEKTNLENSKKPFINEIKAQVNQLVEEFGEEIEVLKNISLKDKKVEDKVKLIVSENLSIYISYLERLITELRNTESLGKDPEQIIKKIDEVFIDFDKKSRISFEKATFIIGDELGAVKKSIQVFFRDFKKLLEENKDIIKNVTIISLVEEYIGSIKTLESLRGEIINDIKKIDQNIIEYEANLKNHLQKLEDFRQSKEFRDRTDETNNFKKIEEEIKKSISSVKGLIDFKRLQKFYHMNNKKMSFLKEYNENFSHSLKEDKGKKILELLEGAKLDCKETNDKIKDINLKEEELDQIKARIPPDKSELLNCEISSIKSSIEDLNKEKAMETSKITKTDEKIKEALETLKKRLIDFDVEIN